MPAFHRNSRSILFVLLAAAAQLCHAQLGLPQLPSLPVDLPATTAPVLGLADQKLTQLRQLQVRQLLRRHRDVLDTDRQGELIVRSELLLLNPDTDTLKGARKAGFVVTDERALAPLAMRLVVLRAPPRLSTQRAMRVLQKITPAAELAFNHIYLGSGATGPVPALSLPPAAAHKSLPAVSVGLIDGGVDSSHASLAQLHVEHWGCSGRRVSQAHGTAVASLLAGSAVAPDAGIDILYSADIYCGEPTGGAVSNLVQAMAWLAGAKVRVINLSLVGTDNPLLAQVVSVMLERGHVLVAAVGNDGPASPPLYPAAYPGVLGVTAVDARQRVIPEAVRGQQVVFAAPGSGLRAAMPGAGWAAVRGTSFAAPLVARLATQAWQPGDSAEQVMQRLQLQALDLGTRGRDSSFGYGLLGQGLQVEYLGRR